jgi:ERCC4-type nuclease
VGQGVEVILVDKRAGSEELIVGLEARGLTVEATTLDYGDVAFTGRGEGKKTLDIGIEFKKVGELIQSIRDGRFAGHQLPGLTGERKMYDHAWLLVEWGKEEVRGGNICFYQRRGWRVLMPLSEYQKHLLTYELLGGIHVQSTSNRRATLAWLVSLYRWWTDRPLDGHTSHLAVHQPAVFGELSPFRKAVTSWPGIGRKLSRGVETAFRRNDRPSLRAAVNAPAEKWAAITTRDDKGTERRLGLSAAEKLVEFFN